MSIDGKSVLAIIPAREGSRRCPEKNYSLYKNKSTGEFHALIDWAVKHARESKYIDTIAISSDSSIILSRAIPPIIGIPRPPHLATSWATSEAVIAHALYSLTTLGEPLIPFHDLFVLLQPTSPLRLPSDIDACIELTSRTGNKSVTLRSDTRQRNGAVYCSTTTAFLSDLSLERAKAVLMPPERSLDIDTPQDFAK